MRTIPSEGPRRKGVGGVSRACTRRGQGRRLAGERGCGCPFVDRAAAGDGMATEWVATRRCLFVRPPFHREAPSGRAAQQRRTARRHLEHEQEQRWHWRRCVVRARAGRVVHRRTCLAACRRTLGPFPESRAGRTRSATGSSTTGQIPGRHKIPAFRHPSTSKHQAAGHHPPAPPTGRQAAPEEADQRNRAVHRSFAARTPATTALRRPTRDWPKEGVEWPASASPCQGASRHHRVQVSSHGRERGGSPRTATNGAARRTAGAQRSVYVHVDPQNVNPRCPFARELQQLLSLHSSRKNWASTRPSLPFPAVTAIPAAVWRPRRAPPHRGRRVRPLAGSPPLLVQAGEDRQHCGVRRISVQHANVPSPCATARRQPTGPSEHLALQLSARPRPDAR